MPLHVKVKFKKLHPDAIVPTYAHGTDSGFDLYTIKEEVINKKVTTVIPTGIAIQIEEPQFFNTAPKSYNPDKFKIFSQLFTYELQLRPKSGLAAKKGITLTNAPGTIDNNFSGELCIIATLIGTAENYVVMPKGNKIAQGVICPVICGSNVVFEEVEELDDTERGDGGFGSTGD